MPTTTRRPLKVVLGVSLCVLFLLPIVMLAGAGGMALLTFILACLGVIGLIAHKAWNDVKTPPYPLWLLVLGVFFLWAWISQFWSPYPKVSGFSNAEKIAVMGLVFPAMIWLWGRFRDHPLSDILRTAVALSFGLGVLLLSFEAATGFTLSFLFDPVSEGESYARRHADATRNIGRGVIFSSVLMMPVAGLFWHKPLYRKLCLALMVMLSLAAFKVDALIAVILPWLGLGIGLMGQYKPELTVKLILRLAVILIVAAPIFMSVLMLIDNEVFQKLPASWEHRLLMWQYVCEQIWQNFWTGAGFDSARSFVDTVTLSDGQSVSLISMHTHNSGLQIWLETGVIGAVLAGLIIALLTPSAIGVALNDRAKALGFCGFLINFLAVASLSFGVWQYWLWATLSFGLAIIMLTKQGA